MEKRVYKLITKLVVIAALCIMFSPAGVFADDDTVVDAASAPAAVAAEEAPTASTDADVITTPEVPAVSDEAGSGENADTPVTAEEPTAEEPTVAPDADSEPAEPAAVPQAESEPEVKKYTGALSKTLSQNGFKLSFSKNVQLDAKLGYNSDPTNYFLKMYMKGKKIIWSLAADDPDIDGYIILRKAGNSSTYYQIAHVCNNTRTYIDQKINKNESYSYTVVGYKNDGDDIRISGCAGEGIISGRKYQNPRGYVQISNKISTHGLGYYTSPVLVNKNSTKNDHIEALIKTAYKYKGDKFVVCRSDRPGKGLDCSGLVMQACYGAGVDLWPINPERHKLKKYEYESRNIAKLNNLKTVAYKDRKRGDLIFFANSKGTVIHVAIYLGNNKIIHSTSVGNSVRVTGMGNGAYGKVCKVKRIFN